MSIWAIVDYGARVRCCWLLLFLLAGLLLTPAARAADVLADVNALRAAAHLRPLDSLSDPLIAKYVFQTNYQGNNNGPGSSKSSAAGCGCWIDNTSIASRYHGDGGQADISFWQLRSPIVDTPAVWQILLDPRARGIVIQSNSVGDGALAVVFDRSQDWKRPIVSHEVVDLSGRAAPAVLLPPAAQGNFVLQEWVGQRWYPLEVSLAARGGLDGASLVLPWSTKAELAVSRRYRLTAAGSTVEFRTAPDWDPSGSWMFDESMTPKLRRNFLSAIARARPETRKMLKRIDGSVLIRFKANQNTSWAGTLIGEEAKRSGRQYFVQFTSHHLESSDPDMVGAVVMHELGHVLDFAGLTAQSLPRFNALFGRSSRWSDDFASASNETFADQHAYYALRAQRWPGVILPTPRLMKDRIFGRMLRAEWSWIPQYGWFSTIHDPRS